ncbi:MAG: hypothetical protein QM731_05355 [Chitinophagaceae bacterium]
MLTRKLLIYIVLLFGIRPSLQGQSSSPALADYMAQAALLRQKPPAEEHFRATCDLAQAAALLSLDSGYSIIRQYLPLAKDNRQWTHVLLMGWAKAETALGSYDKADSLYRVTRNNSPADSRQYREATVATILLWTEYDKTDSLKKYLPPWIQLAKDSKDNETLSFLYCFKTLGFYVAGQVDSMLVYFEEAIKLAEPLADKNALFTAKYNYANIYLRNNPQKQVTVFNELWQLSKDSSLAHYPPKLYKRTAFSFRNAGPSVSYQLMQLNLLLTDYDAAGKFAQEFYDATVVPNPNSGQAPSFNAEMAIVKCYQQDWPMAEQYLAQSRRGFNKTESEITYQGYFIAASLLAEHNRQPEKQLSYIQAAIKQGPGVGRYILPVDLYYTHALVANGKLKEAEQAFRSLPPYIKAQTYAAPGLFYYKYYAELKKAQGQLSDYTAALETYYQIKDSLLSFNRYRAIQEILAKMELREQEQKITRLNEQQTQLRTDIRNERRFYIVLLIVFVLIIALLVLYLRLRQAKMKQQAMLHQHQLTQIEQQQKLQEIQSVMQAEEKQRSRIAAELHNEVNSMLSLSILNVSSELEKNPGQQRLHKALDGLTQVSQTIRNLSHRLDSSIMAVKDFKRAVDEMAELVNTSGKVQVESIVVGFEDNGKHSFTVLSEMYAILQELLQNIIRHANARHALLEVVEHEDHFAIMVEDDGIGIQELTDGLGLKTIRTKVAELKGRMEIGKGEEGGTLVVIEIPVNPK